MIKTIAVMNHKGGVAKTTTTLNIACAIAAYKKKVLVIDMDPQGNAAIGLGIDQSQIDYAIHDVLLSQIPAEKAILQTSFKNLYLLPATFQLAALSTVQNDDEDQEYALSEILGSLTDRFDYILIDCPPSFGLLSLNALIAAKNVIIPVQNESFAISGLQQMEKSIHDIWKEADHKLDFKVLITLNDPKQKLHQLVEQEIRNHFSTQVFSTPINIEPKIAESAFFGKPVLLHAPVSIGARDYMACACEVLQWIEDPQTLPEIGAIKEIMMAEFTKYDQSNAEKPIVAQSALESQLGSVDPSPQPLHDAQRFTYDTVPDAQDIRISLRNGVILALALTLGMALAFLNL